MSNHTNHNELNNYEKNSKKGVSKYSSKNTYEKLLKNYGNVDNKVSKFTNSIAKIDSKYKQGKQKLKEKTGYIWTNLTDKAKFESVKSNVKKNALKVMTNLQSEIDTIDTLITRIEEQLKEELKTQGKYKAGILGTGLAKSDERKEANQRVSDIKKLLGDAKLIKKNIITRQKNAEKLTKL